MVETTAQIETHIEGTRDNLGANLDAFDRKIHSVTDWREYFQRRPLTLLGAFAGGVVLAVATGNRHGFLLQALVVSRVLKFLGVGWSLFIHPIVALIRHITMLRAPSLEAMRWLKSADSSIDYSIGNTTKQALWLPTSREPKYEAKQAVDSCCVRAGDVVQAGVVFLGERVALAVHGLAAVNTVLTGGSLVIGAGLNARLRAQAARAGSQQL